MVSFFAGLSGFVCDSRLDLSLFPGTWNWHAFVERVEHLNTVFLYLLRLCWERGEAVGTSRGRLFQGDNIPVTVSV